MNAPGRRGAEPPDDRQLLIAFLVRAVLGCAIFGGASVLAAGEPFSLRAVVARGLLFGVLVASLHFGWSLYGRSRSRRRP